MAISDLLRVYPETDPYFWEMTIINRHFTEIAAKDTQQSLEIYFTMVLKNCYELNYPQTVTQKCQSVLKELQEPTKVAMTEQPSKVVMMEQTQKLVDIRA